MCSFGKSIPVFVCLREKTDSSGLKKKNGLDFVYLVSEGVERHGTARNEHCVERLEIKGAAQC